MRYGKSIINVKNIPMLYLRMAQGIHVLNFILPRGLRIL